MYGICRGYLCWLQVLFLQTIVHIQDACNCFSFPLQRHSAVVETFLHQWVNSGHLNFQTAIQIQFVVYGKLLQTPSGVLHLEWNMAQYLMSNKDPPFTAAIMTHYQCMMVQTRPHVVWEHIVEMGWEHSILWVALAVICMLNSHQTGSREDQGSSYIMWHTSQVS